LFRSEEQMFEQYLYADSDQNNAAESAGVLPETHA
jgi:hypothetical protein